MSIIELPANTAQPSKPPAIPTQHHPIPCSPKPPASSSSPAAKPASESADSPPEDELLSDLCRYCNTRAPIYTCPACFAETCSLPCCRKHKIFRQCTGIRDPTAFIKRSKLTTPAGLNRDFSFLTGLERTITRGAELHPAEPAAPTTTGKKGGEAVGGKEREKRMMALGDALRGRRTVVRWAPWEGFARARENRTTCAKGRVWWTVAWVLADHGGVRVVEHQVSDAHALGNAFANSQVVDAEFKGGKKCYYFLVLEAPANRKRCVKVDVSRNLAEALRERAVFEFPEFVVTRRKEGPEGWEVVPDERRIVELKPEGEEKKKGKGRNRKRKAGEPETKSEAPVVDGGAVIEEMAANGATKEEPASAPQVETASQIEVQTEISEGQTNARKRKAEETTEEPKLAEPAEALEGVPKTQDISATKKEPVLPVEGAAQSEVHAATSEVKRVKLE